MGYRRGSNADEKRKKRAEFAGDTANYCSKNLFVLYLIVTRACTTLTPLKTDNIRPNSVPCVRQEASLGFACSLSYTSVGEACFDCGVDAERVSAIN